MSFIKKYKSNNYPFKLENSIKTSRNIYLIGTNNSSIPFGIIIKTDFDGNIIWTKSFSSTSDGGIGCKFRNIIELGNGDLLISGYVDGFKSNAWVTYRVYLLCITTQGIVKWTKKISTISDNNSLELKLFKGDSNFSFLSVKDSFIGNSNSISTNNILKIDNNGNVLKSIQINVYSINDCFYEGQNLLVVGQRSDLKGFVMWVNGDLDSIEYEISYNNDSFSQVQPFKLYSSDHTIKLSGSVVEKSLVKSFTAQFGTDDNSFTANLFNFNLLSSIIDSNYTYLQFFNNNTSTVVRVNHQTNTNITRNFNYENKIIYINQLLEDQLLFTDRSNNNSIFGISNLELTTCKSSSIIYETTFSNKKFNIDSSFTTNIGQSNIRLDNSIFYANNIDSNFEEVCPVINLQNLNITSSNISIPRLTVNQQVLETYVGDLVVYNKGTFSKTLSAGTIIASENGIIFRVLNTKTIAANTTANVAVAMYGKALQKGYFSTLINITNPIVNNPNLLKINFEVSADIIQIDLNGAKLQSPDFYLQAVGSNGDKATKGIHLRWEFGGDLGENHIPKGNLANTSSLYNKPDDFVSVYRVPYNKVSFTVDFSKIPDFVEPSKYYWVYKYNGGRNIYIYFRNKNSYLKALSQTSPQDPLQFIQAYEGMIEVEDKADLFFGAELEITHKNENSSLQLEGLSLAKKDTYNTKVLSYRKLYKSSELSNFSSLKIENGRSLKFRAKDCLVSKIHFEFYYDFISYANGIGWDKIGSYSLSLDDNLVFSRLEPNAIDNRVHGRWKRYNDNHYVNVNNYKHKWNVGTSSDDNSWERTIKKTVEKYIELSNVSANPKANETFNFNLIEPNSSIDENGSYQSYPEENNEVSNLDLLKLAALDFHVARMLGMGTMDISQEVFSSEYVYMAVYDWKSNSGFVGYETSIYTETDTFGIGLDLLDYNEDEGIITIEKSNTIRLISMSLPTSINSERLPLPVDISEIKFGLPKENSEKADLYDEQGYTKDGKKRVISIYAKEPFEYEVNPPFFSSFKEFDASTFTIPVYAGLEHRYYINAQNPIIWQSPELSHDSEYFIYGSETIGETLPILLPEENKALYVHFHNLKGKYFYTSYGIDWFSRASTVSTDPSSEQVKVIETELKPANTLLPPTGVNAHLIKEEKPLMFTSVSEQDRLKAIPDGTDDTLVRLLFDYNAEQDIKIYNVDSENSVIFPDDEEAFAEQVEIFYRSNTPKNITAKVELLSNITNNILLMQASTVSYNMVSTGEVFESKYPDGVSAQNFVGGIFLINRQAYVIHSIESGTTNLKFNLYKKEASDILLSGKYADLSVNALYNKLLLEITEFTNINNIDIGDGLFVANENMQTPSNWGNKNPNQLKVKLGNADWTVNRELITVTSQDGNVQNFIEKTRGFWKEATISKHLEEHQLINDEGKYIDLNGNVVGIPVVQQVHKGIYKIEFNDFKLPKHEQFNANSKSVEWFNGFVRLFKTSDIVNNTYTESRTSLKVFRTENIGETSKNLVLYVIDENFKYDHKTGLALNPNPNREFLLGNNVLINYYPSYKVYLYNDEANDLTKTKVYADKETNYSILGLRSINTLHKDSNNLDYASRFAPPTILLAQKTIVPQKPEQPEGPRYTTRPDFYGKATYTFHVEFKDTPFAVQFYRADDNSLLNALYTRETIEEINSNLEILGGKNETFFADRWNDFLRYEEDKVAYLPFLPGKRGYNLPLPNNPEFYESVNEFIKKHNLFYNLTESDNPRIKYEGEESELLELNLGSLIIKEVPNKSHPLYLRDFVKEYLYSVFLPLTEVPVVYNQIYGGDYVPTNKKQNIRDKDGILLKPKSIQKDANGFVIKDADDEFEMAPMVKGIANKKVSFTDFTIDATTDSFYFYAVREIGSAMKFGEFSNFLGPVKVVDANPPEAPKINSALPILSNSVLGINPKVKIEVHSYPDVQKIKRVNLYRTTDRVDAQAVMHMDLVKTMNVSDISTDDSNIWTIYDEFDNYDKVPFGDILYYRITVEKQIEYAKADYITGGENPEIVIGYVPSQASKIISTMIVETQNPESPVPKFVTDETLENAVSINSGAISWNHNLYKGKYHVYKMSAQGNWTEIAKLEINSDNPNQFTLYKPDNGIWNKLDIIEAENSEVYVSLDQLNLLPLLIKDSQENKIYHHFKVLAENNSNMLSTQENILTIFNNNNTTKLNGGGIGDMIIGETFIIR